MAPKAFGLFVVFALLAAACGKSVDEPPTPTRDVPTLSGEAAIGLVSSTCAEPGLAQYIRLQARAVYQGKGIWGVELESAQWEVYEASGVVAPIGGDWLHIACQEKPLDTRDTRPWQAGLPSPIVR